jgi:hypothetical protein
MGIGKEMLQNGAQVHLTSAKLQAVRGYQNNPDKGVR